MSMLSLDILLSVICIFSMIELILSLVIHVLYSCEYQLGVLTFIELSGIIGVIGALVYFILTKLNSSYTSIYLILSNIYVVCMISAGIYWVIGLAIESRRFFDNLHIKPCHSMFNYLMLITLVGNYILMFTVILWSICICYSNRNNKQDYYSHVTLVR